MSLYCEKCQEKTDILADKLCVSCYRAEGKDEVAVAPGQIVLPLQDANMNLQAEPTPVAEKEKIAVTTVNIANVLDAQKDCSCYSPNFLK
jgi:hypothetical protein